LNHFAQINGHPGILRGSAPTEQEVRYLHDVWKVKRIVSLDQSSGNTIAQICQKLGIHHVIFPLEMTEAVDGTINKLKMRIRSLLDTEQPVFIHCKHGEDRTGLAIALYRVMTGWDCGAALREARTFGFGNNLSQPLRAAYEKAICPPKVPPTTTVKASVEKFALDPMMDAATQVRNELSDQFQTAPDLHRSFFGSVPTVTRDQFQPISIEDPPAEDMFHRPQQATTHYDQARADDSKKKKEKSKKRRIRRLKLMSILIDRNDAFPEVGVFRDCNPLFRTLGPIDSGGLKPGNISYNY
jgi:protein tyrosine phosphatase (PTP) superfamily phosphohydrolase (DUF442 family)